MPRSALLLLLFAEALFCPRVSVREVEEGEEKILMGGMIDGWRRTE